MRAFRHLFAWALPCVFVASPAAAQILQPIFNAGAPAAPPPSGTTQVLTSTITTTANNGTRFFSTGYSATGSVSGSTLQSIVFPVAGSISNLRARAVTAPTGSQTWTVTLEKNGVATGLSCAITSTANPCALSSPVSVSAGDTVDFKVAPSGTPTASGIQAVADFTSTNAGDTILMARGPAFSTSAAQATQPFSDFSTGGISFRESNLIPEGGTLDRLFVASNAPGAGTSYAYGVAINGTNVGTPGAISATISGTGTSANDTTNSASVTDGQNIEFTATPTGTPASANAALAVRFVPATSGDFVFMGNAAGVQLTSTATQFYSLTGISSTTEATVQNLANSMTLTKLEVNLLASPGAGTSYTFTINDNGVATALSCTIANTATSCSATAAVAIANGDLVDLAGIPTGTPTARSMWFGVVAHK